MRRGLRGGQRRPRRPDGQRRAYSGGAARTPQPADARRRMPAERPAPLGRHRNSRRNSILECSGMRTCATVLPAPGESWPEREGPCGQSWNPPELEMPGACPPSEDLPERRLRPRRRPLGAETAGTSGGPGRVPSPPAVLPARRGPRWSHAGPHALPPPTRPQPCPPWGLHPRTVRPCPPHVSKYKSQEGRLRPQTCPRTGTQRRRTWRLPRPRGWARPAAEAPPRPLPHPWPAGATVPGQPRAPCRPLLHTVRELPDGGDRRGGADRALSPPESQGGAGGRLGGKAGGAGSWTQHRSAPRRRPAATRSHTPRQDRPTSPKTHRLLYVGSEAKSHLELPRCLHEKHSLRALCDGDGGYGGESQAPPPTALPKYLPGNLQPGRLSLPSLTSDTVKDFQRTRSN